MVAAEARSRRAALALHALDDDDRERVLAMLDEDQRGRIDPMLHELRDLGIPPGVSPTEVAPEARGSESSVKDRIAALSVADVVPTLDSLSPAAVAALLHVADWPWAEAALEALHGLQRIRVRRHREEMPRPAPRMAEALCRAFEATVQGRSAEANAPERAAQVPWNRRWPWKR